MFMRAMKLKGRLNLAVWMAGLAAAGCIGVLKAPAEGPPGGAPTSPLAWDAITKETSPGPADPTADFSFALTNTSDSEVVIQNVVTSCGCTVAKTPPRPWHIAAHTNDSMTISVNLAGKTGTFQKAITVFETGFPNQVLMVIVHMPNSPEARARNMQLAVTDRQGVFKGDCAKCHAAPTEGKMGLDLFTTACEICHNPTGPGESRATMVPNLRTLNHPTDYTYWKMIATIGKPGTLMPGFGAVAGGPLNDAQIDSLAKTLTTLLPSQAQTNALNTVPGK
jgi:mono/diheme cytochrome c family protein